MLLAAEHDQEWKDWRRMGDPVLHIDLRDWADVAVVAPLSAHSLAKFATGLCDDALSCAVRAWPWAGAGKPLVLAPAMNTGMWEHPVTRAHLDALRSFGEHQPGAVTIVPPQVKTLACGETGDGALASVQDIVEAVQASLRSNSSRSLSPER
jgi:phosphopantothenoylcysteine synthetase/decarboxylase